VVNLKLKKGRVVHHRGIDFPDELYPDSLVMYSGRNDPKWGHWALCGAAGTRRLKKTDEEVTCKTCLKIAEIKRRQHDEEGGLNGDTDIQKVSG